MIIYPNRIFHILIIMIIYPNWVNDFQESQLSTLRMAMIPSEGLVQFLRKGPNIGSSMNVNKAMLQNYLLGSMCNQED
jgi:hypothetical protein